jgi:hypothetical protein
VTDAALLMTALTKSDPSDFVALALREIDWLGKLPRRRPRHRHRSRRSAETD